jgi:hypothetical protein
MVARSHGEPCPLCNEHPLVWNPDVLECECGFWTTFVTEETANR